MRIGLTYTNCKSDEKACKDSANLRVDIIISIIMRSSAGATNLGLSPL